jgi:hypothetical protein
MKKYFLPIITILVLGFVSCEKAGLSLTEYNLPTGKAFVRFALLSPGTPAVMIKSNGIKINGANTSGSGGFFPSTATFPDYAAVDPGATLRLALPNLGTSNDSVVLFNSSIGVEAGKFYSVTLADTNSTRTTFATEDVFNQRVDSFINIRLINACVGSTLNLIRIDSTNSTDVVRDTLARNIPYKGTSGFIQCRALTTRPFIRIRVVRTDGRPLVTGVGLTPPQTAATAFRRSVTCYATGFDNGTTTFAPGFIGFTTNQ